MEMPEHRRILVADDHPMCAAAVAMAARAIDPAAEVVTVALMAEAEAALRAAPFDLILLDLVLPDVQGFIGLALVRTLAPNTPVALVTSRDDGTTMRQALALGAKGFLSKAASMEDMKSAVRALLDGDDWFPAEALAAGETDEIDHLVARVGTLSTAQLRIFRAVASGRQNKQIAYDLGLAEPTVKTHLAAIFRVLRVTNRTQAVLAFQKLEGQLPA